MSLSFNSDSVVGGPISPGPLAQIEQRKRILEKRSGRDSNDILFLTSNVGWVKMTSSVDILEETLQEYELRKLRSGFTGEIVGDVPLSSPKESQKNVLTGGTLRNGRLTAGIQFNPNITNQADKAYSKSTLQGYRPDAGITSFQVDTKSMFGALRVASVGFKTNSIEQLNTLESLFLRPGFSILLEWGHSIYVDNNGEIVKTPVTYGNSFFTPAKDSQEIVDRIQSLKEQSSYNYDAMFGIVKNFIWSYNLDGGYDCSVDLISQGELIESLGVIIAPEKSIEVEETLPQAAKTEDTQNEGKAEESEENVKRTPLHEFLNAINWSFERNDIDPLSRTAGAIANLGLDVPELKQRFFNKLGGEDKFKVIYWQHELSESEEGGKTYSSYALIPLSHLLILVNEIFLLKTKSKPQDNNGEYITKFFTGDNTVQISDRKNLTPFITFDYHFALDPTKVILPKGKTSNASTRLGYLPENHKATRGLKVDDILNIFVSTDLILDTLNSVLDSNDKSKQNVMTFMNSLLSEINKQLGNINQLDIGYDESQNLHYIVDRKITPGNGNELKIIDLVGIKSQVENLSFSSKLSNNVTSMMAIAAQAQTSDVGADLLAVQKWNEGLVDRHLLFKYIGGETAESRKDREKRTIPFVREVDLFRLLKYVDEVNNINTELTVANLELDDKVESASSLSTTHQAVMKGMLEYFTKQKRTNPAGLIPFELSLTLRGLSGLKVGQAFKIPDQIIPLKYHGNVGFIITGVSHKLESNRWLTDLQTQMCIISKYEETNVSEKLIELPDREEVRTAGFLGDNSKPETPESGLPLYSIFRNVLMKSRIGDEDSGGPFYNDTRVRNGRREFHQAWDVVPSLKNGTEFGLLQGLEGYEIYMPFTGTAEFHISEELKTGVINIIGEGDYKDIEMRLIYIKEPNRRSLPQDKISYRVKRYSLLGFADSSSKVYNEPNQKDHIHIQMTINGKKADPRKEDWRVDRGTGKAPEILDPRLQKIIDDQKNESGIEISPQQAEDIFRESRGR